MKFRAIAREIARDVLSGTTRTVPLCALASVILVGLLSLDLATVGQLLTQASIYRSSGASIQTISAPGQISGRACEALGSLDGVRGAGAIRAARPLDVAVMPDAPIPVYETSPTFPALLGASTIDAPGVLLSADAAELIGASAGDEIASGAGAVTIAGTYEYPTDGRRAGFGYAAFAPADSGGTFDECWVESWPEQSEMRTLLLTTLLPATEDDPEPPSLSQLNSSRGATFDGLKRFSDRLSQAGPVAAFALTAVLAFVALRVRRLNMATALHLGLSRRNLTFLMLAEAGSWLVPAGLFGSAATLLLADLVPIGDGASIVVLGMRHVIAAVLGGLAGVLLATATTKESHLFRYFKER